MQNIDIVGAMANIFIKHKGFNIGQSIFEKNQKNLIENIIQESKKNNCNLVLPEDVITSKDHNSKGVLKNLDQINDNDLILDIGEKTLQNIIKVIDESKTIYGMVQLVILKLKSFLLEVEKLQRKYRKILKLNLSFPLQVEEIQLLQ